MMPRRAHASRERRTHALVQRCRREREQAERARAVAEERLRYLSDHDPLTGLLNRRAFERALDEHLALGERYGHEGAVLMLDLDDFKQVNDTLGHGAGDELVARVGRALAERLRCTDTVARLGGDEFAILLPRCDSGSAEQVAAALLQTIRAERCARGPKGRERPVSASIGVVPLAGAAPLSGEEALIDADLAMYDAKEAGRDRFQVYGVDTAGRASVKQRLELVERIRTALDEDGFTLHAQPVVEAASGRTTQLELLIRMQDGGGSIGGGNSSSSSIGDGGDDNGDDGNSSSIGDGGSDTDDGGGGSGGDDDCRGEPIPPAGFLPTAERFGLIGEIDRWVVSHTIDMLDAQAQLGRRPKVEVNLSGYSLGEPELARHIARELGGADVDPRQLTFEITETAAIGNIEAAQAFAERLAELGCRFALDDFGAGFSSFYYLKHLPFDFIKIDGEFVRGLVDDATDRLMIRAVVELARGLGKQTIAEFVGDEPTARALRGLGVDYLQGFHLGRPRPLDFYLPDPFAQAVLAEHV